MIHRLILNCKKALRFFTLVFPLSVILENFKFLLSSTYAFYPVMLFFKILFYYLQIRSTLLSVCVYITD